MSLEDKAQELELAHWEINNTPRGDSRKYQPDETGYGPEECDECGNQMPPERRAWGYTLCVHCKEAHEKRDAQRARY